VSDIEVNGQTYQVSARRADDRFIVTGEGRQWEIDAVRVDAHTLSLLVTEREPEGGVPVKPEAARQSPTCSHEVAVLPAGASGRLDVCVGSTILAASLGRSRQQKARDVGTHGEGGPYLIVAPMPGKVVRLLVKPGETVRAHQPVVVVEAMKMENELRTARDGVVVAIPVETGQLVEVGAVLAVVGDDKP